MRSLHLLVAVLPAVALGCGGSGNAGPDADITTYDCAADTRAQTYVAGLEVKGESGKLDFKLMDADPAPPARGNNTWTLQIDAMSNNVVGSGVAGATMVATPFMPDHGHGTPIKVEITDQGGGMYQLTPVNLWMPGYWETTLTVTTSSAGADTAVYKFCLPD